jgi:hypothetical protein
LQQTIVLRSAVERTWLGPALLALLTLALHLSIPLPSDVSWLITVGERLLDGQHLYSDILETNPPMAAWLYIVPVLLGRWTGIAAEFWVVLETIFAALLALYLTERMLRPIWIAPSETLRLVIIGVVLLLPVLMFAQREHFELFALLPVLGVAALRYGGLQPPRWAVVAAGIGMGIALAIKPHAALVILILTALEIWRLRSWRLLFSPENLVGLLFAIAYCAIIAVAYPAFFSFMLPTTAAVYVPNRLDIVTLLSQPAVILAAALVAATILFCRGRLVGPLLPILLSATAGCVLVYLAQGKGWAYQLLPGTTFATIAMAVTLLGSPEVLHRARQFAVFGLTLLVALPPTVLAARLFLQPDPLYAAIGKFGPGQKVALIARELAITNPLSRGLGDTFVNSGPSLLFASGAIDLLGSADPTRRAALQAYESFDRNRLAQDLTSQRPDLILVQNDVGIFDWLGWAKQDPEIAHFLGGYATEEVIPWAPAVTITVLHRRP